MFLKSKTGSRLPQPVFSRFVSKSPDRHNRPLTTRFATERPSVVKETSLLEIDQLVNDVSLIQNERPPEHEFDANSDNSNDDAGFLMDESMLPSMIENQQDESLDASFAPDNGWSSILNEFSSNVSDGGVLEDGSTSDKIYISLRRVIYQLKKNTRERTIAESVAKPRLTQRLKSLELDLASVEQEKTDIMLDMQNTRVEIEKEQFKISELEKKIESQKRCEAQLRLCLEKHESTSKRLADSEKSKTEAVKKESLVRTRQVSFSAQVYSEAMELRHSVSFILLMSLLVFAVEATVVYLYARIQKERILMDPAMTDSMGSFEAMNTDDQPVGVWLVPLLNAVFKRIVIFISPQQQSIII